MARDHARIRLDIWADDDWGELTSSAQWLYLALLSSPSLTFAGIADWHPSRLAARATDLREDDVVSFAAELINAEFILVDVTTDEALIRSFIKHDGLMRSPNVAAAMVTAQRKIASPILRGVLVHQLRRLHDKHPELRGWSRPDVQNLLKKRAYTFGTAVEKLSTASRNPSANPSNNPSGNPSASGYPNGSVNPSGNPSPTPYSLLPTPYLGTETSSSLRSVTRAKADG